VRRRWSTRQNPEITNGANLSKFENIAAVVIGRNEGERLGRCLASLEKCGLPPTRIIYVDSGSSDGSEALASRFTAETIRLSLDRPFCASRGRNAGWRRAFERWPSLKHILFIDGDCELVDGFIEDATCILLDRHEVAVVCGRRRERTPEASMYNRICDLEWNTPIGEANACGGDSVIRLSSLRETGGFNEKLMAGEEPELCQRIRASAYKILRIDREMTVHDANILRFAQWWKRQSRTGFGSIEVYVHFKVPEFFRIMLRAIVWSVAFLTIPIVLILFGILAHSNSSLIAGGLLLSLWPIQWIRLVHKSVQAGIPLARSAPIAALTMLAKLAEFQGQLRWLIGRLLGRKVGNIDYKTLPILNSV